MRLGTVPFIATSFRESVPQVCEGHQQLLTISFAISSCSWPTPLFKAPRKPSSNLCNDLGPLFSTRMEPR